MPGIYLDLAKAVKLPSPITPRLLLIALVIASFSHPSHAVDLGRPESSKTLPKKKGLVSVYASMSLDSQVVEVIDRDTVQVQYEIMGSDLAWCGVGRQPGSPLLGFVPCDQLARGMKPHEEWQVVDQEPGTATAGQRQQAAIRGNQVTVEALITRKEETAQASLVLDTGAATSVISREVAEQLAIDLNTSKKVTLYGVGGMAVEAWLVRIDSLRIGPYEKSDMRIAVIDRPVLDGRQDGLLGMDYLKDFTYRIDFADQSVEWGLRR